MSPRLKTHSKNQDNISLHGKAFLSILSRRWINWRRSYDVQCAWSFPRNTPIYQCKNGHLICKYCYKKVEISDTCPVCKTKLPRDRIRNITAEQVIENNPGLNFPCDFSEHGCGFSGRKLDVGSHEKKCEYRTIPCSCPNVSWKGSYPLTELKNHLYQGVLSTFRLNVTFQADSSLNTTETSIHPFP